MAKQLTGLGFSRVACAAEAIARAAWAGRWIEVVEGHDDFIDIHRREIRAELDRLCAAMDLGLVDAEEATAQGDRFVFRSRQGDVRDTAAAMIPPDTEE